MMKKKRNKWRVEKRRLADLKPNPANSIYRSASDAELDELGEDLDARGQQHPVDILPDGTIIAGEQRWRAAKRRGWTWIRCRVRFDLARAGKRAIEEFLLRDNLIRRQLDPIEQARIYGRLKQLVQEHGGHVEGDLRDILAQRFGKSGRTLDRWLRLLDAPVEVQDAVVGGTLKLIDGGKVADLPQDIQQRIAGKIRLGAAPAKVVQQYMGKRKSKPANLGTSLSRLIRDLKRHHEALDGRVEKIGGAMWARHLPALRRGHALVEAITARIEQIAGDSEHSDLLDDYSEHSGCDE